MGHHHGYFTRTLGTVAISQNNFGQQLVSYLCLFDKPNIYCTGRAVQGRLLMCLQKYLKYLLTQVNFIKVQN